MWQAHVICAIGGFMVGCGARNLWVKGANVNYVLLSIGGSVLGWVGVTL